MLPDYLHNTETEMDLLEMASILLNRCTSFGFRDLLPVNYDFTFLRAPPVYDKHGCMEVYDNESRLNEDVNAHQRSDYYSSKFKCNAKIAVDEEQFVLAAISVSIKRAEKVSHAAADERADFVCDRLTLNVLHALKYHSVVDSDNRPVITRLFNRLVCDTPDALHYN